MMVLSVYVPLKASWEQFQTLVNLELLANNLNPQKYKITGWEVPFSENNFNPTQLELKTVFLELN